MLGNFGFESCVRSLESGNHSFDSCAICIGAHAWRDFQIYSVGVLVISSLLLILSRLFGLMSSGIVQGTQVRFLIVRVAVVDPKHEFVTEQFVAHGFMARGFMFAFASFSIGSSRGSHGQCVPRASRLLLRRRHILAKNVR